MRKENMVSLILRQHYHVETNAMATRDTLSGDEIRVVVCWKYLHLFVQYFSFMFGRGRSHRVCDSSDCFMADCRDALSAYSVVACAREWT
jgi:hypothetical protein